MKHPLDRLLRLRLLLEDVSRMELEVCLQELAQVETVVALRNEGRKTIRQQSFAGFAGADNAVWIERCHDGHSAAPGFQKRGRKTFEP